MGIEPTLSAWEAEVLPLNYTRFAVYKCDSNVDVAVFACDPRHIHGYDGYVIKTGEK
jgi:hypothetical protein